MSTKKCWGGNWKDYLCQKYTVEGLSIRAIAFKIREANAFKDGSTVSCETVRARLKEYDIPIRPSGEVGFVVGNREGADYHNEGYLRQKYLEEGMSIRQIAKVNRVSAAVILKHLRKFNIPRRERGRRPDKK